MPPASASSSTRAASSRWTPTAAPACRTSTRSATSCAAHAGAQGLRGRRGRGRAHRRPASACESGHRAVGHLHLARDRLGGQVRTAVARGGTRNQNRQFPHDGSRRAKAMNETGGVVKMIADARTDELLGVHIFAANGSELIAEAVLAMNYGGSSEDIALTIHSHPTLAEAMHEAALAVSGRAIHF